MALSIHERARFWICSMASGLLAAAALAGGIALQAWVENPGGIFHDEAGTNWAFVADTAWSWFAPLALPVVACAAAVHYLWARR